MRSLSCFTQTLLHLMFSALIWFGDETMGHRNENLVEDKINQYFNGILVPVRTSFGLRRRGGKRYNVSNVRLMWIC